jgi:RNA polymerase sigma-70 factor (ECF subfamily)
MALVVTASRLETAREQALVARARADAGAFGKLYDEYLPRIYGFIARRVEDRAVAEALTAATFRRAQGAVRNDDLSGTAFGGFLYRVAASAVVDHARRSRRAIPDGVRATDLDVGDDRRVAEAIGSEAASRAFAAAVDRDVLRRALGAIPEGSRRVLLLRYFDGLEVDEACAALNSTRPALAVRLHRALRILRGALEQETVDAA